MNEVMILGAGMTGLAAGMASGFPVYEAADAPGGICSSYYMTPGVGRRLHAPSADGAYRFETGGGHWIFGGDSVILQFIRRLVSIKSYTRDSAVYFPDSDLLVPYPIQNSLGYLDRHVAVQALQEIVEAAAHSGRPTTMAEWLRASFGPTLCDIFFDPFHRLYTAGLWQRIAPQDAYKSPVDLRLVVRGALDGAPPVGYNATFVYPVEGLNTLAQRMAERSHVYFGKRVVHIDPHKKVVTFADHSTISYGTLISTLPLNQMIEMTGFVLDAPPDPATSVLVINIGAVKGPRCPDVHWLYVPSSKSGFHRVGFYSNVDASFLPGPSTSERVSIYVERAYTAGQQPTEESRQGVVAAVIEELQTWGWIEQVEVADPTWIDVAYTWSWPGSHWRSSAIRALESHDIVQVGRFARWTFHGIADSIREGLAVGGGMRSL